MAEQKEQFIAQLSQDARQRLDEMGKDIDKTEGDLDALDELGIDTTKLRAKIEWAKKARELVLKRM